MASSDKQIYPFLAACSGGWRNIRREGSVRTQKNSMLQLVSSHHFAISPISSSGSGLLYGSWMAPLLVLCSIIL